MQNLSEHILQPLARRLGTYLATLVLTYGASTDSAHMVGLAATSAVLVAGDLLASYWDRQVRK